MVDLSGVVTGLWALRHAETKSNQVGVYMGLLDTPANPESLSAAKVLSESLRARFTHAYASPLCRAAETAYAIFPKDAVVIDYRLRERSLGQWEGMHKAEVQRASPEAFVDGNMDAEYTPPDGETLQDMIDRIVNFVTFLFAHDEPDNVLIVSHNGWIRTAQHVFGVIDVRSIYVESIPQLEPIRIGQVG